MNKTIKNKVLTEFLKGVSSSSPTPGGGAVAATAGACGASLIAMVCNLSINKKGYKQNEKEIKRILIIAEKAKERFLVLADEDCKAFDGVIKAYKKKTGITNSLKNACAVPLEVYKLSVLLLPLVKRVGKIGNKNASSDAKVARHMLVASAKSAKENILINLAEIKDPDYVKTIKEKLH